MKITGIICEYNPIHSGHLHQISSISRNDPDGAIVCLMSGNYVQRGAPAIFDKSCRAQAALLCGADLVLEMPVTASLSSAEGFADQCVKILSPFCDSLSFGAETPSSENILCVAQALLSPQFPEYLKQVLSTGCSFPAARQAALEQMGIDAHLLEKPNNCLAVEYCKAILSQNSKMQPSVIHRSGDYSSREIDPAAPSATALRYNIENGLPWLEYVPDTARDLLQDATIHRLEFGERAILGRLRTMTDAEFQALPYGSEGLWRKLMKNSRQCASLAQIIQQTKSKRYTQTRLNRMIMCAFLGLNEQTLQDQQTYARVLALNAKGRSVLNQARQHQYIPNAGDKTGLPYEQTEVRCDDLYSLFAQPAQPSGLFHKRRIFYKETIL